MVANVKQVGDKVVLELDASVFHRSGIALDRPLDVNSDTGRVILSSAQSGAINEDEIDRAFEKIDVQYGRMMKKLAE